MSESNIHGNRIRVKRWRRKRAHMRVRYRMQGTAERPRLTVFKSLKHLYAQVIDDQRGHTLAAASTLDSEVRGKLEGSSAGKAAARAVGETVAERAKAAGVDKVVFDRSGYIYHGKIKEIAEGARSKGLDF